MNKLPPSVRKKTKADLHAIHEAASRAEAEAAFDRFLAKYGAKYDKAAHCPAKDRGALLAFYGVPAEHWKHARSSNPIESTFATVRLRTAKTKGRLSRGTALAMVFKLARAAERHWRRLNGPDRLAEVIRGAACGSATASRFKPPRAKPPPPEPHTPTLTIAPGAELRCLRVGPSSQRLAVAVLSDGQRALSGESRRTLRLWDLETGAELCRLKGPRAGGLAVAVLPDGRRALSGEWHGTLRLWDLEAGAELKRFEGHAGAVRAITLLPDKRRALSGSYDTTLRLWDLESGAELRCFVGHTDWVNAAAVLADGRYALSGSRDSTLRLWDLGSGAAFAVFTGDAPFTCLALTPDGRSVFAGDAAGNLHLLDILIEPPAFLGISPPALRTSRT